MLELVLKEYYNAMFIESLKKNRLLRRLLYCCLVGMIFPLILNWVLEYYFGALYIVILECVIFTTIIVLYPKKFDYLSKTMSALPVAHSAIEYILEHKKLPQEVKSLIKEKYSSEGYVTHDFIMELDFEIQKRSSKKNKVN